MKMNCKEQDVNVIEGEGQLNDLSLTDEEVSAVKGGAICHGVSVLAWARVDGISPLN